MYRFDSLEKTKMAIGTLDKVFYISPKTQGG